MAAFHALEQVFDHLPVRAGRGSQRFPPCPWGTGRDALEARTVLARTPRVAQVRNGYDRRMNAKSIVHSVEHPVETAKALEREAEEGVSARTPLIAVTGIALFLGVIFVILLAIALTLYFVYGGK